MLNTLKRMANRVVEIWNDIDDAVEASDAKRPFFPLTAFEMVEELHDNAGHPTRTIPGIPGAKEQELLVGLIEEELKELKEALAAGDIKEVVDALGDLQVVINGAGHRCGVNMDDLAGFIHRSNMSKFCDTMEEAIEGTLKYSETGIKTSIVKNDMGRFVIYREDGKFLKGPQFKEPDIKLFLEQRGVYLD